MVLISFAKHGGVVSLYAGSDSVSLGLFLLISISIMMFCTFIKQVSLAMCIYYTF